MDTLKGPASAAGPFVLLPAVTVPGMMRARHLAAAVSAVVVLAGCSSDSQPEAAPSSAAPSVTSASPQADGREACREAAGLANDIEFDPALNRAAGLRAMAASDPGIAAAGEALMNAASDAEVEPGPDANIELGLAQLDVAEACRAKFGDGPW